jgi:hypothetical protein
VGVGKCIHAHNISELRPRLCKYRNKCNRHKDHPKTCLFVHPDEDIFDYATTHGFISQHGNTSSPDLVSKMSGDEIWEYYVRNTYGPPPIMKGPCFGKFNNPVQSTDPVRRQMLNDFCLSSDDFPSLCSQISQRV